VRYGAKDRTLTALLYGLLGLSGVMLFSGFVRLRLYIGAYGLTWLRILSAWFIIYLAAVLILCAVRMRREKLPLIGVAAMILLGWFAVLGYSNPEGLAEWYNNR
jgi:cytochrome b subunit of formate dehydrogenase